MAKLGNVVKLLAIGAAAGAGTYYYLKKKEEQPIVVVGDEADSTVSDVTKDVVDFFTEKKDKIVNSREYIQLNESAKEATNAIAKTVMEAATIIKEKAKEAKDGVGVVDDADKDNAVDYAFEEFETEEAEATECTEETSACEACENKADIEESEETEETEAPENTEE